ncbi:MAG: glutaredoxin family protein [Vicinamibacterales bacterium]
MAPRTLILHMRPGCHLCEDLRAALDEILPELDASVAEVDITSDDALLARYRHHIPVLTLDGREIVRGRVEDEGALARLLASALRA